MSTHRTAGALTLVLALALALPVRAAITAGARLAGDTYIAWYLSNEFDDLPAISATDLINGFGVNTNGTPLNQGINESAIAPFIDGWIDPFNGIMPPEPALPGIGSWYMGSGSPCRGMLYSQPSSGFYENLPGNGNMADLVDGVPGNFLKSVLRDYARAALVVRYGFQAPTDIGSIRVYAANLTEGGNLGKDGRVFQYYDVYARQGDCADGTCPAHGSYPDLVGFDQFFPVALGVSTDAPGGITNGPTNPAPWEGTMTEVAHANSRTLIPNCTDLRIVLYCVSNTQKFFIDPWQGYANETPATELACSNGVPAEEGWDQDGYMKSFEAPIIKEIDVFNPADTFARVAGDVDRDGDRDLVDIAAFQLCFAGSTTANGCFRFDYDNDADVDLDDWSAFSAQITGP